jgi:hypothetical protein
MHPFDAPNQLMVALMMLLALAIAVGGLAPIGTCPKCALFRSAILRSSSISSARLDLTFWNDRHSCGYCDGKGKVSSFKKWLGAHCVDK